MIVSAEAVVLMARKHGETSKIIWAYSREFGKISVIAKGARETKSKFGGGLEMFARSNLTFYKREKTDGLYLLSKADLIATNRGLLESLDALQAATAIVELMIRTMHDEERNDELYDLLTHTLEAMSARPSSAPLLQLWFYVHFARCYGFAMQPSLAEQPIEGCAYRFHFSTGEILQHRQNDDYMPLTYSLSGSNAILLTALTNSTLEQMSASEVSDADYNGLLQLFTAYFAYHFPSFGSRSLKSSSVFNALGRAF